MAHAGSFSRGLAALAMVGTLALFGAAAEPNLVPKINVTPKLKGLQTPPKKNVPKNTGPKVVRIPQVKPVASPAPRSSYLTNEAWAKAPVAPVTSAEIDRLVNKDLEQSKIVPAPRTTDEEFLRRVSLDLTGRLPTPAEVTAFVQDPNSRKRARQIDKLLNSEAFGRHWARYWREVIAAKQTDRRGALLARAFEDWMAEQIKTNQGWDKTVHAMLTADGQVRFPAIAGAQAAATSNGKEGAAFFLMSHFGAEAANDRAAETARVFLGIQIRCAQCHDHPFDQWKQVQFHELAGYYARLRERPVRDMEKKRVVGLELVSLPRGEHEMAMKNDPGKTFVTHPRFLDGLAPGRNLGDKERRQALAGSLVSKNNYWFAGAYANRIWGELLGQSFYQPVDDMGPGKEVVFANVLARLASSFRATNYNVKDFYRVILNTEAYQRQIRPGDSTDQHLHFAAVNPRPMSASALLQSLTAVLGPLGGARPLVDKVRPLAARFGLAGQFQQLFSFDPSLKPDEVEGSIPQALMLMNNPQINQRMSAKGDTALAKILTGNTKDDDALKALYLRTLARKPTSRELEKCKSYVRKVGDRAEAYEDILWALLNSTEFQTKR